MAEREARGAFSPGLRVWQLAWPTIIANLLMITVQFSHIKIVSGLGANAVAAITTGHRVFFLLQAVLMGLSVATTATISRCWGARDHKGAADAAWTAMALSLMLAAGVTLPLVLASASVAGWFGLDAMTTALAAQFIFWYGLFHVFVAANLMLSTALRATGDVITPLWFLFVGVALNVGIAYSLAYGRVGLPRWGVAGVGLGGGLAAAAVSPVFVAAWWRGLFQLKAVRHWQLDRAIARQLIQIGTPSMLEQGFVQIAILAFFAVLGHYGTAVYAAYGIGISIVSFSLVVAFGFGIATATLVGQHLGAGEPDLAVASGWRSMGMAIAAMFLLSLLLALSAEKLANFMIDDAETARLARIFIYFIAASQPIMAVEITLAGALRGAGDTRFPLRTTITGMLLGRLFPALIFVSLDMSIHWIFSVIVIDYSIKALMLLARYKSGAWLQLELTGDS